MTNEQNDYEKRDVDYSLIHSETKEVFAQFVSALQLTHGSRLLDLGGGYGSVFTNILENEPGLVFHYEILDSSLQQLKKAQQHIEHFLKGKNYAGTVSYHHQQADKMELPANYYDVVVCKMFIHEVPRHNKEQVFKNIHTVLKPGGRVIFWNPDLTEGDHYFFTETIRKKDELARFDALVKNRHFLLNSELIASLEQAGFNDIEKLFDFHYDLHTSRRLKTEFNDNTGDLQAWNEHILRIAGLLEPELKKNLLVDIGENNIHIRFKRAVFKAIKA